MSATQIGELNRRVVLEQVTRSPDGAGGATETWSMVATLFAALRALSGGEGFVYDRTTGRATHEIVIRHRGGVAPAMRFRLGAQTFEILAILDEEGRRRHLRCLVEERDL